MTTKPTYEELLQQVSQLKQAAERHKEGKEGLTEIFEMSLNLICIADMNTATFLKVNPAFTRTLGHSEQALLNHSFLDFVHPDDVEPTVTVLEEKLKNGAKVFDFTNRYRCLDGTYRWLEWTSHPVPERGVTFAMAHDITEQKRVEAALRKSESILQSVFSAAPIGICLMKNRVYQRANRNWCDSFGYPEESLIGRTPEFLYESREEYERVGEKVYGGLHQNGIASAHTRLKRSDGEFRDVVLIANPLNPQDLNEGAVAVVHDITDRKRVETERKKLEAQLLQSQKMEAIGTLAGGIAHDFNNLLMSIQGRTSMVLVDKDSSHPDFEHLREIERNVESAARLTKQLLRFARGGKYEVKPTDLNKLIQKETRMFGRAKKEVSIFEEYDDNLCFVQVDRGQIQQVLLNLYVNAWQAMPGGGRLHIRTQNVTLDASFVNPHQVEAGPYVQISVADTGIGMDKATRQRIFDPFFTTKGQGSGTGLGLASTYGIIRSHGGFVHVYSEIDHGSTFNLYLPAFEKDFIEEKKPEDEAMRGSETVLFVDDEEMIAEVVEDWLQRLGYTALIAQNGREAVRMYEENKDRIDIVVLDMIMPDMSGGETFMWLKGINPDVKVLLSSGYSIDGKATEIMNQGCKGFIQKPFKMKELSKKLRDILDS
ncbi:MAG: PAS domain S-box protein [Deltaproteobacteria bacterium]|nr:PAS domain S-box protein [Deltaproteobacteria bacterium]